MRLVIQRVREASVSIDGEKVSAIGKGLLVLVGVETGDTEDDVKWLVGKTAGLRIFDDENGVMNRSVQDIDGEALAVSQFTLTASTRAIVRHISALPVTSWPFRFMRSIAICWPRLWASRSAGVCSVRT